MASTACGICGRAGYRVGTAGVCPSCAEGARVEVSRHAGADGTVYQPSVLVCAGDRRLLAGGAWSEADIRDIARRAEADLAEISLRDAP
jgi:uncharacterized membrane-anchored protein